MHSSVGLPERRGEMNRITPEQVKAAYEKTGLTPTRGEFFYLPDGNVVSGACGLGVLAYEKSGGIPEDRINGILGIEVDYSVGFAVGFDGQPDPYSIYSPENDDEFRAGLEDGDASARAVGLGVFDE